MKWQQVMFVEFGKVQSFISNQIYRSLKSAHVVPST